MIIYRTYFKLTEPVINFEDAKDYLLEDNMKEYLQGDRRCPDITYDKIIKIEWILKDETSGYIQLETTEKLSQVELDNISDWVSGQNSDGLGEGFSCQDFACYKNEEANVDEDDDDLYIIAEFDWTTNPYKFELISST